MGPRHDDSRWMLNEKSIDLGVLSPRRWGSGESFDWPKSDPGVDVLMVSALVLSLIRIILRPRLVDLL